MPIEKYDVLVVGGGPAGSTAGYLLSKLGLSVLIVDGSHFPRRKLCGGLITQKTLGFLERTFHETESSLRSGGILEYSTNHYEIFRRERLLLRDRVDYPFHFVDRQVYDNFLLSKAKRAGADVVEGEGVIAFDYRQNSVTTSRERQLRAKFIVGADGVNSIIRRSFPKDHFDQRRWRDDLAIALELFIGRDQLCSSLDCAIISFGFVSSGYSWIFPNADRLVVGSGGLSRLNKRTLLESFHDFLSSFNLTEFKASRPMVHLVPYGNFMPRPALHRVALVGDAGGFVDPILGEGIFYAQRTAELASLAIQNCIEEGRTLSATYQPLLNKYIYPELRYAKKMRPFILASLEKLPCFMTKLLLRGFHKQTAKVVHGLRRPRWFGRRGKAYDIAWN